MCNLLSVACSSKLDRNTMLLHRQSLLLICLVTSLGPCLSKTKVNIGLLAPFTGSWDRAPRFASAISIAVDYINNNTTLLQNHTLGFLFHDTVCSESGAVGASVNLLRQNVSVFIGPACSKSCVHAGFVAAAYNIPMVSYGCSTTTLSNTELYPNFFRTKPFARGSKKSTSLALASIMDNFGWKHGCLAEDIDSVFTPLAKEIATLFAKRSIKIGRIERFYQDNYNAMEVMRKLRPFCRSKLLSSSIFIRVGARGGQGGCSPPLDKNFKLIGERLKENCALMLRKIPYILFYSPLSGNLAPRRANPVQIYLHEVHYQ